MRLASPPPGAAARIPRRHGLARARSGTDVGVTREGGTDARPAGAPAPAIGASGDRAGTVVGTGVNAGAAGATATGDVDGVGTGAVTLGAGGVAGAADEAVPLGSAAGAVVEARTVLVRPAYGGASGLLRLVRADIWADNREAPSRVSPKGHALLHALGAINPGSETVGPSE